MAANTSPPGYPPRATGPTGHREKLAALDGERRRLEALRARRDQDYDRLNALGDVLGLRLEDLLGHLGLALRRKGKMLVGPCPVHGGTKSDSFNLYPEPNEGYVSGGNWVCRSRRCQGEFKPSLLGLIGGVLSNRRLGWCRPGDARVPFPDVLRFACDFAGLEMKDIRVDAVEAERRRSAARMETLGLAEPPEAVGWPRAAFRRRLEGGAPAYYLDRGYDAATLARYDVGVWRASGRGRPSPMAGRVAVPVFDDGGRRVLGVSGRTVHPRCGGCRLYHPRGGACPTAYPQEHAKWWNNEGFRKEHHLYNFWSARGEVRRTGVVVLAEGPGDVWRLEEAGVRNAVAVFGNQFGDRQQVLIEKSGAMAVAHLPHADEGGRAFRAQIEQELRRSFRLHFLDTGKKDVGEMSVAEVRQTVLPFLQDIGGL